MGHIKVENLRKEYVERRGLPRNDTDTVTTGAKRVVLDGIDLEFKDWAFVFIIGPSCC